MVGVEIRETNSYVNVMDSLTLLSPPVLERIVEETLKRLRMEQAHTRRVEDERRVGASVTRGEEE
jgi:hypothetical protein